MSKSTSSPQNSTSTATSLTTKNLNVSGNSGFTAVGGEGGSQNLVVTNNTTTTDLGAVKAATGLSSHALDIVAGANRDSLNFASDITDTAFKSVGSAYGNALTAVKENTDNTVSVVSKLASQFGSALYDFTAQEQTQLGNVVSALNSTYTANNTSANQQVINATTGVVKYAVVAAIGIAALYFLTRK